MVVRQYSIVWTKRSELNLMQAYDFIRKDSPQNAEKVLKELLSADEKAITNPEIYSPDKFKLNNDGSYRAFEKHHYRVVYRFSKSTIRVLRVRHTSMEPKFY